VGTVLARALHGAGHDVVILSRHSHARPWRVALWDGATPGAWSTELDGSDVVINLAGRSVNCRYTAHNRREILESRVRATRAIGIAIAEASRPPRVWLQASTATIYAHRHDAPNDEATGLMGGEERDAPGTWKFSIDVARAWERAFEAAATPATRKVLLRSAMTMSPARGGIHANPAPGIRDARRIACTEVDAGDRRRVHPHGDGAHPEKPARGASTFTRRRVHLQLSVLERCRHRPLPPMEG